MYRTHTCGELRKENIGEKIFLSGWIHQIRNFGSIIFIDLRDFYGITQLIFDKHNYANKLAREFIIQIKGIVIERKNKNNNNPTGYIEVFILDLKILNYSCLPPFTIDDYTDGNENIRMKFRYLDIRRNDIKYKLLLRNKIIFNIRKYLYQHGFIEIETPFLIKSTPEGARDFIVPSRINKGKFYALPQSPQSFKQLLMIGGIDKYFQIVKCFRDEDFRTDRQPEFTQVDCEMSFIDKKDIINIFEDMIVTLFKKIKNINLKIPFPSLSYDECIRNYGSDKPDISFGIKIKNLKNIIPNLNKFKNIIGISVHDVDNFLTKSKLNNLTKWGIKNQIENIIWIKYSFNNLLEYSRYIYFIEKELKKHISRPGDILFIIYGYYYEDTYKKLGKLRLEIAERLKIRKRYKFYPIWVIDFPMFKYDEKKNIYHALHHPFTSPKKNHLDLLYCNPDKVKAESYDLVINGNEIGGGSIRIHTTKIQKRIFSCIGLTEKKIKDKFGFFLKALKHGAPPHGGIAIGLDRLVSIISGEDSIRDFIAFPKNNSGKDLMLDTPTYIEKKQLKELSLIVKKK
jgi:aspartyl-tRNA synthetase